MSERIRSGHLNSLSHYLIRSAALARAQLSLFLYFASFSFILCELLFPIFCLFGISIPVSKAVLICIFKEQGKISLLVFFLQNLSKLCALKKLHISVFRHRFVP